MGPVRRPRVLPPGGTIGILSPASPPDPEALHAGMAVLQARGFAVRLAPHALDHDGHRAGLDADRAVDFVSLYADPAGTRRPRRLRPQADTHKKRPCRVCGRGALVYSAYSLAQNIAPGFSFTTADCRVSIALRRPSCSDKRPSSCSMDSTSS